MFQTNYIFHHLQFRGNIHYFEEMLKVDKEFQKIQKGIAIKSLDTNDCRNKVGKLEPKVEDYHNLNNFFTIQILKLVTRKEDNNMNECILQFKVLVKLAKLQNSSVVRQIRMRSTFAALKLWQSPNEKCTALSSIPVCSHRIILKLDFLHQVASLLLKTANL